MSILVDRYVQALFEVATDRGELKIVEGELRAIAAFLADPAGRDLLLAPAVPAQRKRKALLAALAAGEGGGSESFRRFLDLLFSRRRLAILPEVFAAFRTRLLAAQNIVEGRLETARDLGGEEVAAIAAAAGRTVGKTVQLQVRKDPELIGGVRLLVQNRMYDNSVTALLADMRKRLRSAPVTHGGAT